VTVHLSVDGLASPHGLVAVALTLNDTLSPDVHSRRTIERNQLTVCPAGTAGNDCCWPSIVIVMSAASVPQFFAEPVTVMGVPGHAAGGLHSALAWTHGPWRQITDRLAFLVAGGLQSPVAVATTLNGTWETGGAVRHLDGRRVVDRRARSHDLVQDLQAVDRDHDGLGVLEQFFTVP
jgi:hypothetical protein